MATVWNSSPRRASGGWDGRGLALPDVDPQHGGLARTPPGASEPLAQAGDGQRGADLGHRVDAADVDPHLQGRGADRRQREPRGP